MSVLAPNPALIPNPNTHRNVDALESHQRAPDLETLNLWLRERGISTDTRYMFKNNSARSLPGEGSQETSVTLGREIHPDWRRILSNFHVCTPPLMLPLPIVTVERQLEWDDRLYAWDTLEHYWQAAKLGLVDIDGAADHLSATLNPGATLNRRSSTYEATGVWAQKQRKFYVLSPHKLELWAKIRPYVIYQAQLQKFDKRTHPLEHAVLIGTGNAHLIHSAGRSRGHGTSTRGFVDHTEWNHMFARSQLLGECAAVVAFPPAKTIAIGPNSSVQIFYSAVSCSEVEFDTLLDSLEQRTYTFMGRVGPRPHLEKLFGDLDAEGNPDTYSGQTMEVESDIPPCLMRIRNWVRARAPGVTWNQMLVNGYLNGSNYGAKHADDEIDLNPKDAIYSVSLGVTRTFRIRSKTTNAVILDIPVCHGMVLVMCGDMQKQLHEIVKVGGAKGRALGPLINVNVRANA